MARSKSEPAAAPQPPAAPDKTPNDKHGAEETVVVTVTEEPVRRGGHVLTEDGWVPED